MSKPVILDSVASLRAWREENRRAGRSVGLVPTMGALHAGHISLVTQMKGATDRVVTSIFVNPTQFAPNEDFSKYPRTFENDLRLLSEAGGDAVFSPQVAEMYPEGHCTTVSLGGPASARLEDAFRPTHFAGVATVVTKLLLQALPDRAIFGEKDYQQLAVIRRFVRDLNIPSIIEGGITVREQDGLALSSRNVYLTPEERAIAPVIHKTLAEAAAAIRAGGAVDLASIDLAEKNAIAALSKAGFVVDYVAVRDSASLAPPAAGAAPDSLRILMAAKLGRTRLIDNIAV